MVAATGSFPRTIRGVRHSEAWRAGLFALALALATTRGLDSADAAVHLDLAAALTRGETALSIDPGALWVPTRPVAGGLFYQDGEALRSASAPGHALLAAPLVGAAGLLEIAPPSLDGLFAGGAPRVVIRPLQHHPRVIAFILLAALSTAVTAASLASALRSLELSRPARTLSIAALLIGSPLVAYAGSAWTQLPVTAALSFVLYRVVARETGSRARDRGIGVAAALALLVRPDALPYVLIAGGALYAIERGWRRAPSRAVARFVLPVAVAFGALAVWGWPEAGDGWSPTRVLDGLLGLVLSPRAGLLVHAPFTVLAIVGLLHLQRRARPLALLVGGWLLSALVAYGGWFDWPGSLVYGPRFLLPLLPALALSFGVAVDAFGRWGRLLGIASVVLGLLVQLPGALLAHARIEGPDDPWSLRPLAAWSTLLEGDAVGALGVDCALTYVPTYALAVACVGCIGLVLEWRARRRARA
jgi:hypothetical protein